MPYLIALIIKCVFGFWAMSVAVGKGRSGGWFWLAFFFPVIGIIVAYCLNEQTYEYERMPNYGLTVQCPYYQNRRPTYLSAVESPGISPGLPAPGVAGEVSADGKWIACATCGERATMDYARIRKRCPKCDALYDLNARPKASEESEADTGVANTGDDPSPSVPDHQPRACASCGKVSFAGAEFCMFCGVNLKADWACPNCSAYNPPAAKFCMECGGKREG